MPTKAGLPTKREQKRLITILQEDFHFDVVKELIDLYHKVVRSRLQRKEKYKMQFNMLSKIMEYALPKLRVEEHTADHGDKIQFNILLGSSHIGQDGLPVPKSNSTIQIPTQVDSNGTFVVDLDKQ